MPAQPVETLPKLLMEPLVRAALAEDWGGQGDITSTALIPAESRHKARLMARQKGILCGMDLALLALHVTDPSLHVEILKKDGDAIAEKDVIAHVSGPTRSLLMAERVALNFLTHLSGIATLTHHFVTAVAGTRACIACTRKTHAGLRALEKFAVRVGGGVNHRFGLYDAALIKDNHIAAIGSVREAIQKARSAVGHLVKIEVEIDALAQLEEALAAKPDVIMLDNFTLPDMRAAVARINGAVAVEASGGVTLASVRSIAETGVDIISVGALTHSAPALDLALDF